MINVSMDGVAIRIRPVGHLDDETAATITDLLACARSAGTPAFVDLTDLDPGDRRRADALVTPASVA